METVEQLKQRVERVIDILEMHARPLPDRQSKRALVESFKSLYMLKHYFEELLRKESNGQHIPPSDI